MIDIENATKIAALLSAAYPILELVTQKIIQSSKLKTKAAKAAEELRVQTVFKEYLESAIRANSQAKTLLYKHSPRDVESFYVNTNIEFNQEVINCSINELINIGHKLIITGTGGIGKSILFKHLFIESISIGKFIPVLIELRSLNDFDKLENSAIEDLILNILNTHKCGLTTEQFISSLDFGYYVLFFDGFDEVKSKISEKVTRLIFDFCNKYSKNYFVLSSRPIGNVFIGWHEFLELRIKPLNKAQAMELISKLDYDEQIKSNFLMELDKKLYNNYRTFASNPLLLTIMLITYDAQANIPEKLNEFYEQAFLTLFQSHDATKGLFTRERLSQLSYEEFKTVFAYVSFQTFFSNEFDFSFDRLFKIVEQGKGKLQNIKNFDTGCFLDDLNNAVCMLIKEGVHYRYAHRSFQEYFAALYTTRLTDEDQKKLIIKWLKETSYVLHRHSFTRMLYDLQPKRFIINILTKGLTDLQTLYRKQNEDEVKIVKYIYGDIIICKEEPDEYHILYSTGSQYMEAVIELCYLVFPNNSARGLLQKEFIKAAKKLFEENNRTENLHLSILLENGLNNNLKACYDVLFGGIKHALSCINECKRIKTSEKSGFASLIDDL